jgi:hypothetical protein
MPPIAGQLGVAGPAVVGDGAHRERAPAGLVVGAQQERGVQQVVAVGEDVGRHDERVADDALDWMAAAVELGADPLDHDAAPGPRLVRA